MFTTVALPLLLSLIAGTSAIPTNYNSVLVARAAAAKYLFPFFVYLHY